MSENGLPADYKKWWLIKEPVNENTQYYCYRCANTGFVPLIKYSKAINCAVPYETMTECDCRRARRYRNHDGRIVSATYRELYGGGHQFPWTREYINSRTPRISYHEYFYAAASVLFDKWNFNKTGQYEPTRDEIIKFIEGKYEKKFKTQNHGRIRIKAA